MLTVCHRPLSRRSQFAGLRTHRDEAGGPRAATTAKPAGPPWTRRAWFVPLDQEVALGALRLVGVTTSMSSSSGRTPGRSVDVGLGSLRDICERAREEDRRGQRWHVTEGASRCGPSVGPPWASAVRGRLDPAEVENPKVLPATPFRWSPSENSPRGRALLRNGSGAARCPQRRRDRLLAPEVGSSRCRRRARGAQRCPVQSDGWRTPPLATRPLCDGIPDHRDAQSMCCRSGPQAPGIPGAGIPGAGIPGDRQDIFGRVWHQPRSPSTQAVRAVESPQKSGDGSAVTISQIMMMRRPASGPTLWA